MAIVSAVFRGIGQLFFLNSILAGVLIIIGIAFCSRIAAVFALVGSIVGMLVGMALGADGAAIYNGLWGFNSFDAALAIVRGHGVVLRTVGPAGAHAPVLFRDVDVRAPERDVDEFHLGAP